MPWVIPDGSRCVDCGRRWKQDGDLCRQCARENGVDHRRERAADRLARQQAELAKLQRKVPKPDGPKRVRVIRGVEYEVVWDGT